jgi:hypothetical protein
LCSENKPDTFSFAGWDDDVVDEMLATLAPVEGGGEAE